MWKHKIKKLKPLRTIVAACRQKGEKVVFTNGCFDLLHLGHVKYLEQSSKLGNRLIVAVNSDSSVRKLKGEARPVFPGLERAALVAALGCVDYVTIFSQVSPWQLIKTLRPDILAKGGDWNKNDIVGKKFVESYGGRVVSADFFKGYSSSSIIARIRKG